MPWVKMKTEEFLEGTVNVYEKEDIDLEPGKVKRTMLKIEERERFVRIEFLLTSFLSGVLKKNFLRTVSSLHLLIQISWNLVHNWYVKCF